MRLGKPSTEEAASGRSRTPTIVVPGASVSSTGPVCGPRMRGIDPTAQTSSTLPFGALRCVNAVDCDETVWIHTHVTWRASADAGRRSRTS